LKPGAEANIALRLENWCVGSKAASFSPARASKATFGFTLPDRRGTLSAAAAFTGICRSPGKPVDALVGPFEPAG
jgi:hypothetical protein